MPIPADETLCAMDDHSREHDTQLDLPHRSNAL